MLYCNYSHETQKTKKSDFLRSDMLAILREYDEILYSSTFLNFPHFFPLLFINVQSFYRSIIQSFFITQRYPSA